MTPIATFSNPHTAALRANERRSKSEITAAHARMRDAVLPALARLLKELQDALERKEHVGLWWLYEQQRMPQVLERVSQHVSTFATQAASIIQSGRTQAIVIANTKAQQTMQQRIPLRTINTPDTPIFDGGSDASVLIHTMPQEVDNRIRNALLLAASLGITLAAAQQMINQAVDRPRWQAIGLDVTLGYGAYRAMSGLWYQANSDYVEAWMWTTADDERVCMFCESMDGSIHSLDEIMSSHFGCRCEPEPYFTQASDLVAIA